ncbi:hypothetical protein BDV28DRAFT_126718 [Aspergillus coremiiformis]|uniref:Nucleolar protein Dnt1-like N-terminal domain-containing protein n=1 Tax=Aspergillus coremiiformis TaxID=138285 RepID=A0A5N6ZGS6_9EURO|nr:hypothetical protein BDV28DRAFT_126718 [Aspergillus coremiiformis]
MVFLRLVIKVYPRDQLSQNRDARVATTPASFLVALPNPEEITLGQLARIIRAKWTKLRPNAEPLDIKKLLDDRRDSVDLDIDMTVADVWVNKARARKNEDDQDGTVRVVQRPVAYTPVRFPSVDQDWGAGEVKRVFKGTFSPIEEGSSAGDEENDEGESEEREEESERERLTGGQAGLVGDEEDDEEEGESEEESERENLIDDQAGLVGDEEDDEEEGESEEISEEEEESEEEGGSESEEDENEQAYGTMNAEEETADKGESKEKPTPGNDVTMEDSLPETRVLKRKMSPEDLEPKKQPRLEEPNYASQENDDDTDKVNGTTLSSPLGARKRDAGRAPSFSGLGPHLSFEEMPAPSHGLGLDSTPTDSVPKGTGLSRTSLPPSSALPIGRSPINQKSSTPGKVQTPADKVRQLQSALRKNSPAERSPGRRVVSFAERENHVIPTSVPAPKSILQTTKRDEMRDVNSGLSPGASLPPASPEEEEEEGLSTELNLGTNEFERELQANNLDIKSEYARKLKQASAKWKVMKNNEDGTRKREQERYSNSINALKKLHREIVELKEFNKPPSQHPRSQTPSGTPATRKLSRPESGISQSRNPEDLWDVEIPTPKPNSKKLIPKELPSSQTSRKSQEREPEQNKAQSQAHRDIEVPHPKLNGTPAKQPELKISTLQVKLPSPPAESESEEEPNYEEEHGQTEPSKSDSVTQPTPTAEVSNPNPESESESEEEEEQSDSDEEEDEDEDEEEKGEEEKGEEKPTKQPTSMPDAESEEEIQSDTESESETSDSENEESEKENQIPQPTPITKLNPLHRTSLPTILPSSQNNSARTDHPTSSQSTPTGSRPPRQTLKGLLIKQREEQSEKARLKAETEKVQRQRHQSNRDIFSGPSDSESEEESDSDSDSGADAGDILSSGTVGKLRTAVVRH